MKGWPTRGFTRKKSPAFPGSTWGCTLDITKYKIESPGKSPVSAGSGGLGLQLITALRQSVLYICNFDKKWSQSTKKETVRIQYVTTRCFDWHPFLQNCFNKLIVDFSTGFFRVHVRLYLPSSTGSHFLCCEPLIDVITGKSLRQINRCISQGLN